MSVIWKEGEYWLRDAVRHVRFPPDRKRVRRELYEHMLSRNLELLARGCSEEEADRQVCAAMGDPDEVGRALAEVHKPFWGYFLRAARILTALVLVLCAVHIARNYEGSGARYYRTALMYYDVHMEAWVPQTAKERCGDYRFRLLRAGVAGPREGEQFIPEGHHLVLELRAGTWDPTLGPPWLHLCRLTAEDSLGNQYDAFVYIHKDLVFTGDLVIVAHDFDPAAEWAVLTVDAGERSFRLPVDLKGVGT